MNTLTRDDILNASNEQLDIWCAELRLQLRWYRAPMSRGHVLAVRGLVPPEEADEDLILCGPEDMDLPLASDAYRYVTSRPTTDPAAAWELLEWAARNGFDTAIICGQGSDMWYIGDARGYPNTLAGEWGFDQQNDPPEHRPKLALVRAILLRALETGRLPVGGGE